MRVEAVGNGWRVESDDGRVVLGPGSASVTRSAGAGPGTVRVETDVSVVDSQASWRARATNTGDQPVALERLTLCRATQLAVGDDPRRWRLYRNGYQSWAGTWTIGVDERDRDVPTRFGRTGVTDAKHPSAAGPGHVRSDSVGAVADPLTGDVLAVAFTTLADAFCFVEVDAPGGHVHAVELWVDLDGTELAPGASTPWFEARLAAGRTALRDVIEAAGAAMSARSGDGHHPSGWCSWYYYFTKVTEADVLDNLAVLAADGVRGPRFGCEYVMVDDGHQRAIGDWLDTNEKFPSGMASVASRIRDEGFDAGIWWAPFIVSSKSKIAAEHPDWLVRTERGRPVLGLINPGWGVTTPMWVLDTTHPEVLEHLRRTAAVIGDDWGYRIQKIDFLYAAALPGRRHDAGATRAEALRRGLQAVRDGAGDDAFVLGCGCPLGPAVGLVDAMRIGADVTPSWSSAVARSAGRDRHALATSNALMNTLTRAVFDGAWFLNDPDCLMVRDRDTKLTLEEVRVMCTVFGMTDGMVVLSDRMDQLSPARQELVARTHALAGGTCDVVDLFERAVPELLVSRHGAAGGSPARVDVGLLNLSDGPRRGLVDVARFGLDAPGEGLTEYWTGAAVTARGTIVDLGLLPPHSARIVQLS